MNVSTRHHVREGFGGLLLSATIAVAAMFLSEHYGSPAMLFALLIGIAFNFLADHPKCGPGVRFASQSLLRIGIALLGLRLQLDELVALGWTPILAVCGLVGLTIGAGFVIAAAVKRPWQFGLLSGGAVAICGASAALAIASVLPKKNGLQRDTLFTVVAVTSLSTVAMIVYPIVFRALEFSPSEIGFLIGATVHDVAQVIGAAYSVGPETGDVATYIKLQRVAFLPIVLVSIIVLANRGADGPVRIPWFVVAFFSLVLVNSFVPTPEFLTSAATQISTFFLLTAIAALGVKTSLKDMVDVGGLYLAIIVAETLVILGAAILVVVYLF